MSDEQCDYPTVCVGREVGLSPAGVRASVDHALKVLREEVPHAETSRVRVTVNREGAALLLSTSFRIKKVDGTVGIAGNLSLRGKVTGEGFVEFAW